MVNSCTNSPWGGVILVNFTYSDLIYSEKRIELARIRAQLEANGGTLPPEKPASEHFDSNCITPVCM